VKREVRWQRMFPDELEAAAAQHPVVYQPLGLCEPHGPGNAVGLDAIKAEGVCVHTARKHGGIVAPTVYWHAHEIGAFGQWSHQTMGSARPWLTSLPPWMYLKNLCYQFRAFDALGLKVAVALSGHAGPIHGDTLRLVELLQPHLSIRLFYTMEFRLLKDEIAQAGWGLDHAGAMETAFLWAVAPQLVDSSRWPPRNELPGRGTVQPLAVGGDIYSADRRLAEQMIDTYANKLHAGVHRLIGEYDRVHPDGARPALSFADVDRLWAEVIRPELSSFGSMQAVAEGLLPPEDSRWRRNCAIPEDTSCL